MFGLCVISYLRPREGEEELGIITKLSLVLRSPGVNV
jgi:hypothetical protein